MKNAYKLIAVDMDGTLLQSDKTVHEDTVRDIQAAVDGGIPVVYCTGRAVVELEPYFAVLPMMRYAVCYSGALVYDSAERKAIYRAEIAREYIEKIVRTAAEYKAMPHILTENDSIVSSSDIQHMDQFRMGGVSAAVFKSGDAGREHGRGSQAIRFRSENQHLFPFRGGPEPGV